MGKVHYLKNPKNPQIWFCASDWHLDHLHIESFNILCKHAKSLEPWHRNLIINGDFNDFSFLMPKNEGFKKWIDRKDGIDEFFIPHYEDEIKLANDTLDALQMIFKNIIFIHGNHDGPRVDLFREKFCPNGYKHIFHLDESMGLKQRGIKSIPYNDWLDFGKIAITHGMFHGPTAHLKHYMASGGKNTLFSHIHQYKSAPFMVRGETRSSTSTPSMATLNPEYLKNAENSWHNGYVTLYMKPNGNFNLSPHLVWNNELMLPNGKIIYG